MNARVVVLGTSRYKFPQEGTGEIIEGCKVHYVEQNYTSDDNSKGAIPQAANLPFDVFEQLVEVPAIYDAAFSVSLRGKKPSLKVTGFNYVSPFSLAPLAKA